MPSISAAIVSSTFLTARCTPLPRYRWLSPSRSSIASRLPVEAPEGTAARPHAPESSWISTSMVGLPRESRISRAKTPLMADTLRPPLQDVVGQRTERNRARAEAAQPLLRPRDQCSRLGARGLDAVQRGIRRLVLALVAARGLAELGERAFDVEDIIDDLEGQPEAAPRLADGGDVGRRAGRQQRAHPQRRADEGRRLVQMDVLERLRGDDPALGLDVD